MLNRRKFLKFTSLLGLVPIIGRAQENEEVEAFAIFPSNQIRVVQCATNATSTLITVLAHRDAKIDIEVLEIETGSPVAFSQTMIDMQLGDFLIYQLYIVGLKLEFNYNLLVHNRSYNQTHKKSFRSLDWNKPNTKVAILSCANHRDAAPKAKMFRQLFQVDPDVILFAGDLVYANSSMDTYFGRPAEVKAAYSVYTKTLMEFEIYERERLIPIFAAWDDHDLAFNNSDMFHPYKETMMHMFRSFFPADQRIQGLIQGPGTAFSMNAFGMQIIFFDTRYYKNEKAHQFLSRLQTNWISHLCRSNPLPKMLISTQQYWNYRILTESYQKNATEEFNELLMEIKRWSAPVVFISGDVHYSQIQEIQSSMVGYKTFEITSSAFFSSSARGFGKRSVEEGQSHYYGYPNFMYFDQIQAGSKFLRMKVTCVSENSLKQFSRDIVIQK